jgi:quercetin dioxygenase-like cupin family protein
MNPRTLLQSAEAGSLDLATSALSAPAGIVSRTVLDAPGIRVVLFSFGEGQELTGHSSKRRAVIQILTGECEFLFNETWQTLKAGTLLHLPPGHAHAVRAISGGFSMLLTLAAESVPANQP